MNAKLLTPAEITALSTTGQREYAKAIDVKRAASDTKATLAAKLLARTLELAPAAAPAKPKSPKGICNVCHKRRIGSGAGDDVASAKSLGMCNPCATEGGWENTHQDQSHAAIWAEMEQKGGDEAEYLSEKDLAELEIMKSSCWICQPKLNAASEDYQPRQGSSKAGMTVIAKGDKIGLVVEALRRAGAVVVTEQGKGGFTGLVAQLDTAVGTYKIECGWYGRQFHYPAAQINGKKFRNVAELFRVLGLKG